MDRYVMWVTLMVIYMLLLVNGILVLATVDLKLSDRRWHKKYKQMYNRLLPLVQAYVEKGETDEKAIAYEGDEMKTQVMLDLLLGPMKLKPAEMRRCCEGLGYVEGVLGKAKSRGMELQQVKQLGTMASPMAFEALMHQAQSDDFEKVYQSYYAISLLPLAEGELEIYVEKLLASDIMRDRIIEMLNNLSLDKEVYWRFLEKTDTELGKVVFLRVLENRLSFEEKDTIHSIVSTMKDKQRSKEIRIASVVTLASTEAPDVLPHLLESYQSEETWEVRAAIAKALNRFPLDESKELIILLKEMLYDANWWVRFNAAEVLARKGLPGIDALVDISLNDQDQHAADLAYYILNASQSVYHTIQKAEVESVERRHQQNHTHL